VFESNTHTHTDCGFGCKFKSTGYPPVVHKVFVLHEVLISEASLRGQITYIEVSWKS